MTERLSSLMTGKLSVPVELTSHAPVLPPMRAVAYLSSNYGTDPLPTQDLSLKCEASVGINPVTFLKQAFSLIFMVNRYPHLSDNPSIFPSLFDLKPKQPKIFGVKYRLTHYRPAMPFGNRKKIL